MDWWQSLKRRKGGVLLCLAGFAAAGLIVTKLQTPVYESRATLEYVTPGELPSALRDGTGGLDGSDASLAAAMQTYVSLLQHPSTLAQVVSQLGLDRNRRFLADPAGPLWARVRPTSSLSPADKAVQIAARDLGVRAQARIIQLTYDAADPKLAAAFLNTLTAEFLRQNNATRQGAAQNAANLFYKQAADLKQKLDATDRRLQSEIENLGDDSGPGRQSAAANRLNELSGELARAEADRMQKQARRQVMDSASPESLAEGSENSPAREYMVRLTDLRRQLAEQSAILTPSNYKVRQIQDQITVLQDALKTELARLRTSADNDYRAAEQHEQLISNDYLHQARAASTADAQSVALDRLRHEADADWAAYAAAFQKARDLSLGAITPATDIRAVGMAEVPSRPLRPNLPLNLSLALFGGLLLGVVQAVYLDRRDLRVRIPGEAAELLGFPELAAVPYSSIKNGTAIRAGAARKALPSGATELAARAGGPPSAVTDSFRQAAASLCLRHDLRSRVIVVTSPGPGEGKTTVTSNLAATLAMLGSRVLLIDGDLRRPRLHQVFQIPNTSGLSTLLRRPDGVAGVSNPISGQNGFARDASPRDGFPKNDLERPEIHETEIPGLFVLPSGNPGVGAQAQGAADLTNLLCSPRMQSLIRRLRHEFDLVLIDSPPALLGADARMLARLADGVVLVLRSGETRRDAAVEAMHRLLHDRANVLGYILNGWDANAVSSYYSDMYRHYQAS